MGLASGKVGGAIARMMVGWAGGRMWEGPLWVKGKINGSRPL